MDELPQTGKVEVRSAGKDGRATRMDAEKYWAVRRAILKAVPISDTGLPARDLPGEVERRLPHGEVPGGGSVSHYTTLVRGDLEVRGLIMRNDRTRPLRLFREEL